MHLIGKKFLRGIQYFHNVSKHDKENRGNTLEQQGSSLQKHYNWVGVFYLCLFAFAKLVQV